MCDFSKITYLSYLRYLDLFFPKKHVRILISTKLRNITDLILLKVYPYQL